MKEILRKNTLWIIALLSIGSFGFLLLPHLWAHLNRTILVFMILMETYGNGAWIGMSNTLIKK